MNLSIRIRNCLWKASEALIFLLLMVWSMPGTIALRYGLLLVFLPIALVLWKSISGKGIPSCKPYGAPLYLLGLLTAWIAIVIAFWSVEPDLSWQEFRGQWLSAVCIGVAAWLLASAAAADSERRVREIGSTIFWSMLTLVLLHNVFDALYLFSSGSAPFRMSPMMSFPVFLSSWPLELSNAFVICSPDKMSYATNLLAAILVAEVSQRLMIHKRWINCNNVTLGVAIIAVLLCSYWLRMRNGNIGLLMLLTVAALMLAVRLKRRVGLGRVVVGMLVVVIGIALLAGAMIRSDERWLKFEQTIPIAWDTGNHRAWIEHDDYPLMPNGDVVDISAYERLSWMKESIALVYDKPMGMGYNRNVFGDSIERKYAANGKMRGAHAHTDIVDFTVANGIIGTAIWLCFLGSLFWLGWRTFQSGHVSLGLAMMFLVSGFMGRSIVDSNIRDDTLQQFMFLALTFYGLAASKFKTETQ